MSLLTARDVAARLGVSSETVLRWTRAGKLPGFRMPGGALRYLDADLEASLAERATSEPPNRRRALLFPTPTAGVLNLNNFRNRVWLPAIEASGVRTPARIYDLRSTFASNALAAGITVFELARVMGTSVEMIERHYGPLLDGSGASMASRLGAFEAEQARADESARTGR